MNIAHVILIIDTSIFHKTRSDLCGIEGQGGTGVGVKGRLHQAVGPRTEGNRVVLSLGQVWCGPVSMWFEFGSPTITSTTFVSVDGLLEIVPSR